MPKGIYKRTKKHRKNMSKARKGQIPWNKGTKGIMKPNSGSFKKGHPKPKNAYSWPKGKNHPYWKGSKYVHSKGYVLIYKPNHPHLSHPNGYVFEHRFVVEKYLKRYLKPKEKVHHINENPSDNRIQNLMVFKNGMYHMWFHRKNGHYSNGIVFDGRKIS